MSELLDRVEDQIGYAFSNRELLVEALTHRSYLNEAEDVSLDNQRLEFLGDSVVGLVVARELFRQFPNAHEGQLSTMLSQLVCETALAERAQELDLGSFLLMGRGEEKSGGRLRPSLLADAFESLLGAVFLDGGLDAAERAIFRLMGEAIASCRVVEHARSDFKSRLQKLVQSSKMNAPTYRIADEDGPDHSKTFVAEVLVEGETVARGVGRSKKEAEQRAAESALVSLGEL